MSTVVIGQVLDELGLASQVEQTLVPHRVHGFDVRTRRKAWATPCDNVRRYQPSRIPILNDHDHGSPLGEVRHLELRGRHLWAVGVIDVAFEIDQLPPLWFSPRTHSRRDGTDVVIEHLGVVAATAQVGTAPIRFLPGRLDRPEERRRWRLGDSAEALILERAADTARRRRDRNAPIAVHDEKVDRLLYQAGDWTEVRQYMERQHDELGALQHSVRPHGPIQHSAPVRGSVLRVS